MHSHRLLVVSSLLLVLCVPTPAAAWKWLSWLDELSGPGPFDGKLLTAELACSGHLLESDREERVNELVALNTRNTPQRDDWHKIVQKIDDARRCRYDRRNVRYAVVLEAGWWSDRTNANYADAIRLTTVQSVAYVPLRIWNRESDNRVLRSVELGAGLGAYRLTGPGVVDERNDLWRGSVPLRIRVFPSELLLSAKWLGDRSLQTRRLLQAVQFRAGGDFLPGLLSPDDFVLTPGSTARASRNEWVGTWGFTVDLGAILWAANEPKHEKYQPRP